MRCDTHTIEKFNVDLKAECVRLNLAHVTRKIQKRDTKTNKRQCPLSSLVQYRFKIREGSAEGITA